MADAVTNWLNLGTTAQAPNPAPSYGAPPLSTEMAQATKDYVSQVLAGGWTDAQKAQMIRDQAVKVGVTPAQLSAATGYDMKTVNDYMALAPSGTSMDAGAAPLNDLQSFQAWKLGLNKGANPQTLSADYKVPDWMRATGLMTNGGESDVAMYQFLKDNPQYAADYERVMKGGTSQFATDGSTLKDLAANYRMSTYDPSNGDLVTPDGQRIPQSQYQSAWKDYYQKNVWPESAGGTGPGMGAGTGTPTPGQSGATSGTGGTGTNTGTGATGATGGSGQSGSDLSMAQQSLLKALMDQQERDAITGEIRGNASELYDRTQGYEQDALKDVALLTGGNSGIYNRYMPDIENDVGTAVADARTGQTAALNTAARQAMRYGVSIPTGLAGVSSTQASQLAGAANTTRNNSINNYRNLVGQGIGLKDGVFKTSQAATADSMGRAEGATMANRNMRVQDESLDWAKQLDVTGMARGMPGASNGAYGVAVGAGNSAVQNQMAPGQALIGAMGQSNNTTMQGQQTAMQGTLGVLNAQSNYANSVANSSSGAGGLGSLLGGAASVYTAFSDRRLKENIEAVGVDPATGLTIYQFEYIGGSGKRYEGVMADEAEKVMPAAVFEMPDGFKMVNYQMLGIEMKEVA